ncbi:Arabinanase/levansucrase/invertase [Auriculariales sp. MPI-PUGE-AT-0066]|nr:Arabinanase/levansucrase/invertase [Auriculariales sp. MPI-PUGE-AT-0066]
MLVFQSVIFALGSLVATAVAFTNPIKSKDGSSTDLTSTTWTNVQITRAATIEGLKTTIPKVIWTDTTASRCCKFWAPEIHFTAGSANTYDDQRIHVLEGSSVNIWDSTWSYLGMITAPNRGDVWSIDSSILFHGHHTYLIYSTFDGPADQCIYIAQLSNAYIAGNATKISTPTYSWEREGADFGVNEGPVMIYHKGRSWLHFSASYCGGTGYKLGRLELTGSDPLLESSWTKYPSPVFVTANGVYQPGHNGFFTAPSGAIWNVYHANFNTPGSCDGSRYTAVQPVNWFSDGTPDLGSPIALGTEIAEPL